VVAGTLAPLLMYRAWKYPYNHETLKSSAPSYLTNLHRVLGWVFVIIYLWMMYEMLPRMWDYQVELPARTVAHLVLGLMIGALLMVKVIIVRFFKHMEAMLAPLLGTLLLVSTLVLMGIALPSQWREYTLNSRFLASTMVSGDAVARIQEILPTLDPDSDEVVEEISTAAGMRQIRGTFRRACAQCHDLRTVLSKPRTPKAWHQTVQRMADRSTVVNEISDEDVLRITAYLIAISPRIRDGVSSKRQEDTSRAETMAAVESAMEDDQSTLKNDVDVENAKKLFETRCVMCHTTQRVFDKNFNSKEEIVTTIKRMATYGLQANADEVQQIIQYVAHLKKL